MQSSRLPLSNLTNSNHNFKSNHQVIKSTNPLLNCYRTATDKTIITTNNGTSTSTETSAGTNTFPSSYQRKGERSIVITNKTDTTNQAHNNNNNHTMDWIQLDNEAHRISELEFALREALKENRRIHEVCAKLALENDQLKSKANQLCVVSMLYDAAKMELSQVLTTNQKDHLNDHSSNTILAATSEQSSCNDRTTNKDKDTINDRVTNYNYNYNDNKKL